MSTVAVSLLTWNSMATIKKALDVSFHNAGRKFDELIWVDNGSEPDQLAGMKEVMDEYQPTCQIFFAKNTGAQIGFNTCMAMPRSDFIVPICPDSVMPDNWLAVFMEYMEKIPNTGVATMYDVPVSQVPERYRQKKEPEVVNGMRILRAMPMGIYIVKREILKHVGYFREDFGLYGWGDVEWAHRLERILPTIGQQCYVLPDHILTHLGSAGAYPFNKELLDSEEYWKWKQAQSALASNQEVMTKARNASWPFYSPF